MKKNILIVLSVFLLLFSLAGCDGEKGSEIEVTTTQVSTTVVETTTIAGITESEAIALAEDVIRDYVDDEFLDEHDLFVSTSSYKLTPSLAFYDSETEKWKVEILGQCDAKDCETGRYLGRYGYELNVYLTNDGTIDWVNFKSLVRM